MEVGVGISQVTKTPQLQRDSALKCVTVCMKDMAATLLAVMLTIPYICEGGEMTQHNWYFNLSTVIYGLNASDLCVCDSTAEKIVSNGVPACGKREAIVRVFSRGLQLRGQRVPRSDRQ